MASLDVIRTLTIRARAEGVDATKSSVQGLGEAYETSARRQLSMDRSLEQLERRFVQGAREAQEFARVQRQVNLITAQNPELQTRANAVLDQASKRLQIANDNTVKYSRSNQLARFELINLSRQIQDVGVGLASGQSVMQVAIQQGSQIADVFASAGVSLGAFARQVRGWLGMAGSIAIGLAAVTAGAIALYEVFRTRAPTTEKILEEHTRLLGIIKDAYDRVTQAVVNWDKQSRAVTRLQLLQQEIEVVKKLNEEITKALRPTVQMDIFTGQVKIRKEYEAFSDAIFKLNEGWQQGTPNVREFTDEIARIAEFNPALQTLAIQLVNSVGDASKFEQTLKQINSMMKLIQGGTPTAAEQRMLGLPETRKIAERVNEYDRLIKSTREHIVDLRIEAETIGMTESAVAALRLQRQAENAAKEAGVKVNQKQLDDLKSELESVTRLAVEARKLKEATEQAASSIESAMSGAMLDLADGTKTAAEAFDQLGRSIARAINQMVIQLAVIEPLRDSLRSLLMGLGSFVSPAASVAQGAQGGVVGQTVFPRQIVPATAFIGAPHFQSGGAISGSGVPIIAHPGERILNRAEAAAYNRGANGVNVVINNNAPGVTATASKPQQNAAGGMDISVLIEQIDTAMATRQVDGRSKFGAAMASTNGLRRIGR